MLTNDMLPNMMPDKMTPFNSVAVNFDMFVNTTFLAYINPESFYKDVRQSSANNANKKE